ncbi:bleomycin hydrolase [Metamycoplasma subdolum]|uniref:Aminopeptidase n=1 Tax=Metamycoplasma subdolum TaxID=92407 RepID=A0A3L9ZXN3_9BACT|nr:C1 family peptidase [Metamycoplasma subdolum]RMA77473.1 bleomycin hydrolase [Metamycoplasma subdolum]WPB50672.1 C1 family peptidase [Metamycoplasma subdolum]
MNKIDEKLIKKFEQKYLKDTKNLVVENAIIKNGIRMASINNEAVKKHTFNFSNETKIGSITDQKFSGRCWIFAALNVCRSKIIEELNLESFEISQNYINFYDLLEKANVYLNFIDKHLQENKKILPDDRLFRLYNDVSVPDGGYWEFFVAIIEKYGVCPKEFMIETFESEKNHDLLTQLDWRMKAYAKKMEKAFKDNLDLDEIKKEALEDAYNILVKSLGHPPKTFTLEYYDKDKKFHRLDEMSPVEFYKKYVGETLKNKVDLIADPRDKFPKNRLLHSQYIKNVYEDDGVNAINISLQDMKQALINSIKDGNACWFGCDVSTFSHTKLGILDPSLYNYDLTLTKTPEFCKKDRFEMRASLISHAMNMVGVNLDKDGKALNWKVENSWGEEVGKKGIFSMSDEWFDEYNYQAIVDKKYLPKEVLDAFNKPVIELDPFDPII